MTYAFDNNDPTTAGDDSTVTDAYDSLGRIIEETQTIGSQPTQVIDSAWRGRRPAQPPDLPQRPRRGLHLRHPRPAQDGLRPGGLAADRRLRLHRRGPGARAALPAGRDGRDLPQQRRDGGHRLRRHAAADRDARPAVRQLADRRLHLHLRPDGQQAHRKGSRTTRPTARPTPTTRPTACSPSTGPRAASRRCRAVGRWTAWATGSQVNGQSQTVLLDQRADPDRRGGRRPRDGHLRQQRQRDRRRHVPLHLRRR